MMRPSSLAHLFLAFVAAARMQGELTAADSLPAPKAEHVLLVVWDGMRPDFITPENTPNLHALAKRGTFFANNHSFWPTTTEVNGTVLATGVFPSRSTVVANREYRPAINPRMPVATDSPETMRKGDELTGGHYLGVPTVAELVRQAGKPTAIAGTKPVALLHDRAPERSPSPASAIVFGGKAFPTAFLSPITDALGAFPPYKFNPATPAPNTAANRWTTQALLEHLWRDGIPRYSVLWLSDPDFPQHATSPGHPAALAGIHDSDTHLGMVVAELQKRGELDKTDIFVVSDHGFSTTERSVKPIEYYNAHGVSVSAVFTAPPKPGQVLSVNVGGATSLYVPDHDSAVIAKLVTLLQQSDFAGAIFTRAGLPGTWPLHDAHIDSPEAADIVFSFRWRDAKNAQGTRGLITAENKAGTGMHGTLSQFDVHNTLVAGGPDIRAGFRSPFPSGNIDVAPTIMHLLGVQQTGGADGRVLTEALAGTVIPEEKPVTKRLEAQQKLEDGRIWKQYLQTTTFAGRAYFDEANGSATR